MDTSESFSPPCPYLSSSSLAHLVFGTFQYVSKYLERCQWHFGIRFGVRFGASGAHLLAAAAVAGGACHAPGGGAELHLKPGPHQDMLRVLRERFGG